MEFRQAPEFLALVEEIQDLRSTQALLGWDLETMMPKKGAALRSHHMATLARLSHDRLTSDALGEQLSKLREAAAYDRLSPLEKALVRQVGREYDKAAKIPSRLVTEMVQTTTEAHHIWAEARKEKDFAKFAPILEKIVRLNREMAEHYGYEASPYDALLDEYEPGLTTAQVTPVFSELKKDLIALLDAIRNSDNQPDTAFLHDRRYGTDKQMAFSRNILEAMGFDFDCGRLDLSVHPFTSGTGYADVRLTTRVDEHDLFSALSSSMHEGGHGMYEQGVNPELARTPLGDGTSLGIHESQSRLWENIIGRGRPFWEHYYPELQSTFKDELEDISLDRFHAAINAVTPSFIRVEADEVTYNLHIMVRFEVEKDIIEGRLDVKDIAEAWNARYREYLGITPPDDALGALQDVHWSHGAFGYFPTYTLGNLYSAQFYNMAGKAVDDLDGQIRAGQLKPLKNWLNREIHWVGKSETADEICQRVTGESLTSRYFVDYLWNKFSPIYRIARPVAV